MYRLNYLSRDFDYFSSALELWNKNTFVRVNNFYRPANVWAEYVYMIQDQYEE